MRFDGRARGSIWERFYFPWERKRRGGERKRQDSLLHLYLDVVSDYLATKRKAKLKDKPLCKDCQSKMIFKNLGFSPTSRFLIMGDKKSSVLFKQAKLELLFLTAGKKISTNISERLWADGQRRLSEGRPTVTKGGEEESSTTHCWCQQARSVFEFQTKQGGYLSRKKTHLRNQSQNYCPEGQRQVSRFNN